MAVAASFIPPVSARWDKSGLPLIPGAVNLIDAAVTKFSAHNRLRGIRVRRQMSALRDFAGTTLANSFSAHGIVHGGGALSVRDAKLAFFAHIDALLALSE